MRTPDGNADQKHGRQTNATRGKSVASIAIDVKKNVFTLFYFGHVFLRFLTFFYFSNVFFIFKKRWQSSERQAD